jgi:signal transduction histidine kinase
MSEELSALNERLQAQVRQLTEVNDDLATLLASSDIATVVLDAELRIKRFTRPATTLLNLSSGDVARPITDIDTNLIDVDLARDARTVMETEALIEHEATTRNARHYVVRMLPCRSGLGSGVGCVVVTMMDVTSLKTIERQLRSAHDALEQRVAEQAKWLALMHEITRSLNEASSWDERLHDVLRCICLSDNWQVGFVYLPCRDDENQIEPAISYIYDERFRPFFTASEHRRYSRGDSLPGRVYTDHVPVWLNETGHADELLPMRAAVAKDVGVRSVFAVPIRSGAGVIAVMELCSDTRHEPDRVFENLMNDVSVQIGKVLDRERSTAQVADVLWREQQGMLHTLHDALGQTLTGLGMLSSGLRQRLITSEDDTADTARQIAHQAQVALEQVRQLTRSFFPLDIDPAGLLAALRDLACTTESFGNVRVRVSGKEAHHVRDGRVANQLYRIAEEAVTNAVRHAQADTIHIDLTVTSGVTQLRVRDNGVGMRATRGEGLGLGIMRYRAASIGGRLSIRSADGGGTTVTCALRETPLKPAHGHRAPRSS